MLDLTIRLADRALRNTPARALICGLFLGWLSFELASLPDETGSRRIAALVMLLAGGASFVLHALHLQQARRRVGRAERDAEVRRCASVLGCGVLLAIVTMQRLAG